MNKKLNFRVIVIILFSAMMLGIIYNSFSSDGIPFLRQKLTVKFVNIETDDSSTVDIKGLRLAQVFKLFEQERAIFIDARDQWEFSEKHILGALNIPEFSFTHEDSTLQTINKNSLLIIYCDGDNCDISKRLTNELMKIGYKNSYVFLGGMKEWIEADLPLWEGAVHE